MNQKCFAHISTPSSDDLLQAIVLAPALCLSYHNYDS